MRNTFILVAVALVFIGVLTLYITRFSNDCDYSWDTEWSNCIPDDGESGPGSQTLGLNIHKKHTFGRKACPDIKRRGCTVGTDCKYEIQGWSDCKVPEGRLQGSQTQNIIVHEYPSAYGQPCPKPLTKDCSIDVDGSELPHKKNLG